MSARAGVALVAFVSVSSAVSLARADVVYELGPTVSVGWTDNAYATVPPDPPQGDEFSTLSLIGRVKYRGLRTEQGLGYRFGWTRYFHAHGPDSLANELSYSSNYNLTGTVDLQLGASAALSRTSALGSTDVGSGAGNAMGAPMQTVVFTGAQTKYLNLSAFEGLSYTPSTRRRYTQSLTVSHLGYLSPPYPLPNTTFVSNTLRGEWQLSRDVVSLQGTLADSYTTVPAGSSAQFSGQLLYGQLLAGWHRDLSVTWSVDAALGGVIVVTPHLDGIAAPAGNLNVGYRRLTWFATIGVSQTAAPNLYVGNATLNDSVVARLSLPLTRSELYFVTGFGGYTWARVADGGSVGRFAYELASTGVSLTARSERLPLWGSLDYGYTYQKGSLVDGELIPNRTRNVVILTIGGSFQFGKGTPPIFNSVL